VNINQSPVIFMLKTKRRYSKIPQICALRRGLSFLFIFSLLQILVNCTTLSPVSLEKENPAVFLSVEAVQPQWQMFSGGIDYFHGKIASPKLEFWALRIEFPMMSDRIVVKSGAMSAERTLSIKVSSFVLDNGLIAGINTVPFDVSSANEGLPIQNMGVVISEGQLIAPVNPRYDALVFFADGRAAIVNQTAINSTEYIVNAAGGFHKILVNGEPAERTQNREGRHARTAAGISVDSNYLYLLVIDGGRFGSIGSTEKETALLLRSFGSVEGINFDGGGSSALALRYPDGKVRVVNNPVHGGIPGRERAVAGCLGIR
jgi:exopolysaccharide biosynthesis protein